MFTGIITHLGLIEEIIEKPSCDLLLKISTDKNKVERKLENGCSIACNGICLTLIEKEIQGEKIIFSFEASKETCDKTTLKNWKVAQKINLEFALRAGDELGGHLVSGHVDGLAKIIAIKNINASHQFTFEALKDLMKFIAQKGSATIDGVSLTVNDVEKNSFHINVISHTFKNTIFQNYKIGDSANLEIDIIARYAAKLSQHD
jgi:riboflavin synthase